ncbi:MAG: helix-turn-helix domain-containing protein [Candidatus Tyrphobacter sp.]
MATLRTLREWRVLRGETQREASAAVGIHPVTWSEYERGKMIPSATILRRIAYHCGCSSDDILLLDCRRCKR